MLISLKIKYIMWEKLERSVLSGYVVT